MPFAQSGGSNVGTSQIIDNEIMNADINAAAAIAWTKISKVGASVDDLAQSVNFKTTEISLSSAEILALHTTPKEVIAAPGAGKIIVVDEIIMALTVGGIAYSDSGYSLYFIYDSDTNVLVNPGDASCFGGAANKIHGLYPQAEAPTEKTILTNGINKSVQVKLSAATANGNGTVKIFAKYRIITL